MPGATKSICEHEKRDIFLMWNKEIKSIEPLLPKEYSKEDIISLLKYYYPYEWEGVESKYLYYKTKDKYLKRFFGKTRFGMPDPESLIQEVSNFKKILSRNYKKLHEYNYSEEKRVNAERMLWNERKDKIERIKKKIEKALNKTQQVTPEFIDKLIGLYERKKTTQKDRVYILLELKKYYCRKVIQFFFKLNDIEINRQLRYEAFYHLQEFNFNPRLRDQKHMQIHTKNEKRKKILKDLYSNEKYDVPLCPDELEYRIENSKEQKIKSYDYFISHSSKDSKEVQDLIIAENRMQKNIFCDWINDVDYLKRHLLCEATLKVLEERMKQSKALIFVESENSLKSKWCKYELNYFYELQKPIYYIKIDSIKDKSFDLKLMDDKWYLDSNYKKLALLEGLKYVN